MLDLERSRNHLPVQHPAMVRLVPKRLGFPFKSVYFLEVVTSIIHAPTCPASQPNTGQPRALHINLAHWLSPVYKTKADDDLSNCPN
jgi:hypothetical protein